MTALNPRLALEALKKAKIALENGDKQLAKKYARKAAFLKPDLEEAWLILAAVSPPAESIRHLNRALAINPASERARKGMHWASSQLRKANIADGNKGCIGLPVSFEKQT